MHVCGRYKVLRNCFGKTFAVCKGCDSAMAEFTDHSRDRTTSEASEEKQWVAIQKQTFTNWVNDRLKDTGLKVEDLRYQFDDGITLVKLLEVLAHNKKMPR